MTTAHTFSALAVSTGMSELDELMMMVERAWVDDRDGHMVERLAKLHPEHADDLYEFFDVLLLADVECPDPAFDEMMERAIKDAFERFVADEQQRQFYEDARESVGGARVSEEE